MIKHVKILDIHTASSHYPTKEGLIGLAGEFRPDANEDSKHYACGTFTMAGLKDVYPPADNADSVYIMGIKYEVLNAAPKPGLQKIVDIGKSDAFYNVRSKYFGATGTFKPERFTDQSGFQAGGFTFDPPLVQDDGAISKTAYFAQVKVALAHDAQPEPFVPVQGVTYRIVGFTGRDYFTRHPEGLIGLTGHFTDTPKSAATEGYGPVGYWMGTFKLDDSPPPGWVHGKSFLVLAVALEPIDAAPPVDIVATVIEEPAPVKAADLRWPKGEVPEVPSWADPTRWRRGEVRRLEIAELERRADAYKAELSAAALKRAERALKEEA